MSTLVSEQKVAIENVAATDDTLTVDLSDGRSISVPLAWYPRLLHGTPKERAKWELIASGEGIHWPELDENISLDGILAGRSSGESQPSLERWLQARRR